MKSPFKFTGLCSLALSLAAASAPAWPAAPDAVELKGPIPASGAAASGSVSTTAPITAPETATPSAPAAVSAPQPGAASPEGVQPAGTPDSRSGLGLAPGEDGTITPDMLLISPTNGKQLTGKALSDLVGNELTVHIDRSDVAFEKLHGLVITVTNNTNRPVVVDGDRAKAIVGGQPFTCVPVSAVQLAIVPHYKLTREFEDILAHVVPAAVTVGAYPTVRDYMRSKKPVLERYGPDELRRKIEYSRFGRRILWTEQKVTGIVYFDGSEQLAGASMEIPCMTMFDNKDSALLTTKQ